MASSTASAVVARHGGRRIRRPRRRRYAAAAVLVLAAALGVAGCGQSGGSAKNAPAVHAPDRQIANGQPANGSGSTPGGASRTTGGTSAPDGRGPATTGGTPSAASYLVRTAHLTVRTPHVERQLDAARALATAAGGYAGDENTTVDAQDHAASTIDLRVPPAAYDGLLTRLAGLGTLVSRQVNVEDVTGQVVDVDSRIASQKASVARVRALMDRANGISDVVALENELTTRESALEALEAQQASLRSRTDLATISLRLVEPPAPSTPHVQKQPRHDGFWTAVGHGLRDGWHALAVTLRVVMVVLAVLLPFLLLGLLGWSAYRLARRLLPTRSPERHASATSPRAPGGASREVLPYPTAGASMPGRATDEEATAPDQRPADHALGDAAAGPVKSPKTGPAAASAAAVATVPKQESATCPADEPAMAGEDEPAGKGAPSGERPDA